MLGICFPVLSVPSRRVKENISIFAFHNVTSKKHFFSAKKDQYIIAGSK